MSEIDIVVGAYDRVITTLAAHDLNGAVGQDLIDVHVVGGTGAGLENIDHDLVIKTPREHLIAGFDDGSPFFGINFFERHVGERGRFLDVGHRQDQFMMGAPTANAEIR